MKLAGFKSVLGLLLVGLLGVMPVQAEEAAPAQEAPAAQVEENPLLVTVNGEPIHLRDLWVYSRSMPALTAYMNTVPGALRVLEDLINQRLLLLEGQRQGIPRDEGGSDSEYVMRVRGRLMEPCRLPGEDEARKFYDEHPEMFSSPLLRRVSRIFLPVETQVEGKGAEAWLQEMAALVRDGKLSFDEVSGRVPAEVSEKIKQGDMGFLPMSEQDPLIELLTSVKVGEVAGPYTREGLTGLFAVTDERKSQVMDWASVKPNAARVAYSQCMQTNFAKLRKTMEAHFPVVYDRENLSRLTPL